MRTNIQDNIPTLIYLPALVPCNIPIIIFNLKKLKYDYHLRAPTSLSKKSGLNMFAHYMKSLYGKPPKDILNCTYNARLLIKN